MGSHYMKSQVSKHALKSNKDIFTFLCIPDFESRLYLQLMTDLANVADCEQPWFSCKFNKTNSSYLLKLPEIITRAVGDESRFRLRLLFRLCNNRIFLTKIK